MARFRRIHWSPLAGLPVEGMHPPFFCIWPEPVDYDQCFVEAGFQFFEDSDADWDQDLKCLIADLFNFFEDMGGAHLVRGDFAVKRILWIKKVDCDLRHVLWNAVVNDQFAPCVVGFGRPTQVTLAAANGHPIFWIGMGSQAISLEELLNSIARDRECVETHLDWGVLQAYK